MKNNQSITFCNNKKSFLKKSKHVNFVTENEIMIANKLKELNLIHFTKLIDFKIDKKFGELISEWEFP